MLMDATPGVEDIFSSGPVTGYIGFDPTAPSMTIGNLVQIMLLDLFQRTGNKPIVLMGGATGLIGDPSFKNAERDLKSIEEVNVNIEKQKQQCKKLLDFDSETTGASFVNNYDFYKEMKVLDFLRDVGKTLTVNYMSAKESVKKRMETGISYTEFSYQLLQGYDFQVLYETYDCKLQMGGSDQWGNITAGTEFVRRNLGGKAYAVTTPLLTKADGSKFGKSETGNIWLDPTLTNPYQFYQFWLNSEDSEVPKLFRYFSRRSRAEIEAMDVLLIENPNEVKRQLAEELTRRIHSEEALQSVRAISELLFGKEFNESSIHTISAESIHMLKSELPVVSIQKSDLEKSWLDVLTEGSGIFNSKGEAKRAIQANAVQINRKRLTDSAAIAGTDNILLNNYIFVENGKKAKYVLQLEGEI